jgi:hypothetical protein
MRNMGVEPQTAQTDELNVILSGIMVFSLGVSPGIELAYVNGASSSITLRLQLWGLVVLLYVHVTCGFRL